MFVNRFLKLFVLVLVGWSSAYSAVAAVVTQSIEYSVDGQSFTGFLAYDDAIKDKRPGVLVVHEWWGVNEYAHKRAQDLAKEGYVAFALDMYGTGVLAEHPDKAKAFMMATLEKMEVAEKRFQKAREILAGQSNVDAEKLAAIGYCFGGGIVLHMARTGEPLKGVASFHGSVGTNADVYAQRSAGRFLLTLLGQ